ncbi:MULTISPECIES: SdrD B-like domain-containing protein [unclassified Agrococcus]|uniref:SdrD B-like domain-containing protein n=1 Tax=unclassified Agrococcus TaxID=2615065 RepID=UPI0036223AC6
MSITAALVTAAVLASTLVVPLAAPAPRAEAAPVGAIEIGAGAEVSATTLYGDRVALTLTASNETSTNAYNVAFRAILPAGTPAGSVATASPTMPTPRVTTLQDGRVLAVWSNVADLVAGATVSLDVTFLAPPALTIGASVPIDVAAAASTNPRNLAAFTATGAPDLDGETGANTTTGTTELAAFEVEKTEPNAEAELLRGAQDHATVYTITVRNNLSTPTSGISIVDHLPAGLEFLGCGTVDASPAGTEEYPDAGRLPALAADRFANPCVVPTSVTSVETDPDGDGPLPLDVYTRVEWTTATLAAAGVATTLQANSQVRIDYAAAVPLRENALPAPAVSTSNLEDNTGALTADEQSLVNHVAVTGTTLGAARTVATTHEVVAEDVSIHKSVQEATSQQGATSTWTLVVESSEYATATGPITVTDVMPTALDFAGSATPHAVATVDGREVVTWVLPGFTDRDGTQTITYTTTTRTDYVGAGPVSAADSWSNDVELSTTATVITANDGTTSQLEIVDASSAGQSTGLVTLRKDVANAPAAGATLDCSTVAEGSWSDTTATGAFAVGDRVCWRITAAFPAQLDTLDVTVTDFLPAGFAYEAGAATYPGSVQPSGQPTVDGQTITWQLGTIGAAAAGQTFVAIIPTTVTGDTARAAGDLTANLAKLSYRNSAGDVLQLRDDASAVFAAPLVTIDKSTTRTTPVSGGDVVPYSVTVRNAGTVPVTGVDVRDLLPAGIACAMVSGDVACSTAANGRAQLQWDDIALAVGESATRTYSVTIPDTFRAGTTLTNTAGVLEYVTTSNTGVPTMHVPASNVDPTRTSTPGTAAARDDQSVSVRAFGLTKTNTTSVTEGGNAQVGQATIGETVTYTVRATIPAGTTATNLVVEDRLPVLPSRLEVTGASATLNGQPLPEGFTVSQAASGPRVTAPSPYTNVAGSGDDVIELVVTARVLDISQTTRATTIRNTANILTEGLARASVANDVRVVEPQLTIAKSHDDADGRVTPGQVLTYTVTPRNAQGAATAHDLVVVDTLPADLIPIDDAGAPLADGAVLPNGGAWDADARTLTWTLAALAPNASQPYAYRVQVASPLTAGTTLRNEVAVTGTSMAGPATGERVSGGSATGYAGTTGIDVAAPEPTIAKTALDETPTIGESIQYRLVVTIPASTTVHDVTVRDALPAGIVYDGFSASSSASGDQALTATPLQAAGATGTIGFFLGDVASAPVERTLTITVDAYVAAPAQSGQTLVNTSRVHFNATDVIAGIPTSVPAPSSFTDASAPSSDDVTVIAPVLAVDKDVEGQTGDDDARRAKPGDTLAYAIVASNTGTAPAYDVVVTDAIDERLLDSVDDLTDLSQAGGIVATVVDGELVWTIAGPLAAGASVELRYTAVIPGDWDESQEIVDGPEVVNTADVTGFGLPAAQREADPERHPAYDAEQDVVGVEVDLASIGDTVWYDVDGDGTIDDGEPLLAGVAVTVTRRGGGEEPRTVLTDEQGRYLVEHLPAGEYDVTIATDAAELAGRGLVPSFDGDGRVADGALVVSLAEDEAHRDADFGVRGAGTIGDDVWFDRDRDFVRDAGEGGIAGASVTVRWAGVDGQLDTADDVVRTTTTAASGAWSMSGVPAGDVRVSVSLPAALESYAPVTELDEVVDGSVVVALALGETRTDLDFGFAGAGVIGDRVWLDRDGDGVDDAGEPGLAGVQLELVLTDGAGTASTFTTVTAADGSYAFDGLPQGDYVVRVVGPLPAGVANTFDPDAVDGEEGDSRAEGSIGDGEELLDVDFGFHADVVLGDLVWLDRDGDGIQGEGEPGIQGVTVRAEGPNGLAFETVTDADGGYLFPQVVQGAWTVTIVSGIPEGVEQTSDADGLETPGTSSATLTEAGSLAQDFGYAGGASLGDLVWLDRDGDGQQGVDEPGLAGVLVTLTWQRGEGLDDVVLTTRTDASGLYAFPGLAAGTYVVAIDDDSLPAGVEHTFDVDGVEGDSAGTATVVLAADEIRTDVDFGVAGSGTIGDLVWLDRDGDGVLGETEHGLEGVRVLLTWEGEDGELGTADDETFATVTSATGAYAFSGLPAGEYVVAVDAATVQPGLAMTFAESGAASGVALVTLDEGERHATADFGYRGTGSLGDLVWLDRDGDDVRTDTDPGVPAQPVRVVWAGRDGVLGTADDLAFDAVTDASGTYLVDGLPDGVFQVTVVGGIADVAANVADPDGGDPSTAVVSLDAEARERLDVDFGYGGANTLGDTIWWDDDANGVDDEGEPRLAGVSTLVTWLGPDGELGTADDLVIPTLPTDAEGRYVVSGLPDGTYSVAVTGGVPAGLAPSVDAGDVDGADGAATTTLVATDGVGQVDLDVDFGFAGSGSLGDLVWLDVDGDGERDEREPGLEGVTVTVTWHGADGEPGTGDERTWTTTVDDAGAWSVGGLPAGSFDVVLTGVPAGLVASADPDGGDDAQASTTLEPGQQRDELDFGFVGAASVGDTIWLEVDGDGVQSALEPGVEGVTVTVTSAGVDGVLGTDDDLVIVVETDADGHYLVAGLPTGATSVSYDPETLPAGTAPVVVEGAEVTGVELVVEADEARDDVDFPVRGTQSIEGVVWLDEDGDGVRDADEPGIPGVTVEATWDGPLGPITLVVVTDADGAYTLPNVPAGDWTVRVDLDTVPPHLVGSTPGTVDVSVPIDGVGSVEHGLVPTGEIGDLVFHDEDRDGVRDAGEAGIGGVTVRLVDADGDVVAETVTAADGSYLFEDVAPGAYVVRIDLSTVPSGYVLTQGEAEIAVEVGPGQSVLTADFPLAAPVVAPLPRTGGELALALLGVTLLLLLAGAALVLAARRRRAA